MHQGNWKCSKCGGTITELPFQPRSESGLTCRACWSKDNNKGGSSSSGGGSGSAGEADFSGDLATDIPADDNLAGEMPYDFPEDAGVASEPMPSDDGFGGTPVAPGEKQKITGQWKCSSCGGPINSLPFNPRDTSGLKCLDCYKQSRN